MQMDVNFADEQSKGRAKDRQHHVSSTEMSVPFHRV
jgi:hypothetical protein